MDLVFAIVSGIGAALALATFGAFISQVVRRLKLLTGEIKPPDWNRVWGLVVGLSSVAVALIGMIVAASSLLLTSSTADTGPLRLRHL
jgi:hypothetical protein